MDERDELSRTCGCQLNISTKRPPIHYCGLHGAAPGLLNALEHAHAALVAIRKHILPHVPGQTRDFHEEIDAAAAAISKAKGAEYGR